MFTVQVELHHTPEIVPAHFPEDIITAVIIRRF